MTKKANMESKKNKIYLFLKKNIYIIILINFIIVIISPWLFTRNWGIISFTKTGEIGDTIGGITAPFINILNAFLIFLTFQEQKVSNKNLESQLDFEKNKEVERLNKVKELILYDLEHRIKHIVIDVTPEIKKTIANIDNDNIKTNTDYFDLNDYLFRSNKLTDYKMIFNQDYEDLRNIIHIYNRVNFIYKHTPLQISYKYPTDPDNIIFNSTSKKDKVKIIERNKEKKKIELEKLINVISSLVEMIDRILSKYQNNFDFSDSSEELF